ncbi:MAG: MBL fold metallo-hydrolase [Chloroflexi bacterium]|nr:MBL fold metallo-hydrolase [Chloroflexota bacterium]
MEIVPGIHQLKLPAPIVNSQLDVNAYLIEGGDGWLMVDTGWDIGHTFTVLRRQLEEIGVGFGDISRIIITHFHPDHYGLAGRVKELSKGKVYLHQIEQDFIHSRYISMDDLLEKMANLLRLHGVPAEELPRLQRASMDVRKFVLPSLADITLHGGETISNGSFDFQVIWTPGHSPGHVCLYEPNHKILLSGDHLLPTIFSNVGLHPQSGDKPLDNYLRSLQVVEQLEVDLVLPAHEHVFDNMKQRIKEIQRHHEERKAAIIDVLVHGARTAYEVSFRIPWILNGVTMSFQELPALDKRLAVMSALAHLEPLCAEGKVEESSRDGTVVYRAMVV